MKRFAQSDTPTRALVRMALRSTQLRLNTYEAEMLVRTFLHLVSRAAMKRGRIVVPDFGVFYARSFKARTVRNPATGSPMEVVAMRSLGFRASRTRKWPADEGEAA